MPLVFDLTPLKLSIASCFLLVSIGLFLVGRMRSSKIAFPVLEGAITGYNPSLKIRLLQKSSWLIFLSVFFALIALFSPQVHRSYSIGVPDNFEPKAIPTEGHAIFFLIDRSTSMLKPVAGSIDTRLQVAKEFVNSFISSSQERASDQIGLMSFARVPRIISPLTVEHKSLKAKVDALSTVANEWENGTSMAYALYKSSYLIDSYSQYLEKLAQQNKNSYSISNSILILVTDGFNQPHPDDVGHELRGMGLDKLKSLLKDRSITLYIVNVEPNIELTQFLSYKYALSELAQSTGGSFYVATSRDQMKNVFDVIDHQTRSKRLLQSPQVRNKRHYIPLSPLFLLASFGCLFIRIMMEGLWRPGGL